MVAAHPYFPGARSSAGGDMQQPNVGQAVNQTSPVTVCAPNRTLSRTSIVSSTQPAVEGDVRQPIEIRPTEEVPRTPARKRTPLPNRLSVVAYSSQESIADVETKTESEGNSGRQTIEVQTDVSLTVEGHVWVKTVLLSKAAFSKLQGERGLDVVGDSVELLQDGYLLGKSRIPRGVCPKQPSGIP